MIVTTGSTIFLSELEEETQFFIQYLNSNGCTDFDTLTVDVFDEIGLEINGGDDSQVFCRGFSPIINSTADVASNVEWFVCLLYTSPSPRDATLSRMPSSA